MTKTKLFMEDFWAKALLLMIDWQGKGLEHEGGLKLGLREVGIG